MSNRRWYLWILLLLITIGLSIWGPEGEGSDADVVQPVVRPRSTAREQRTEVTPVASSQGMFSLASRDLERDYGGVFRGDTRAAPPPKVVPAAPVAPIAAPVPAAPPLPLRFIGRMVQKGQPVLFLTWGERNLAMRVGDVAEATYRLESIKDTQAEFMYLPQETRQTLTLSGGK